MPAGIILKYDATKCNKNIEDLKKTKEKTGSAAEKRKRILSAYDYLIHNGMHLVHMGVHALCKGNEVASPVKVLGLVFG